MTVLVKACLEKIMVTLIFAKMLLKKYETVIKTCISYHRLVDIIVGFVMSLVLKKTDNRSSSYGCFSEGVSLGERCLPHAKSKAKLGSPLLFPYF